MPENQPTMIPSAAVLAEEVAALSLAEREQRDERLQEERALRVRACADARQRAVDRGMRRCGHERGKEAADHD